MLVGGTVRVISQRYGGVKANENEKIIFIDRSNPILGNPYTLKNHTDNLERENVIQKHRELFDQDVKNFGPIFTELLSLAVRVADGEKIALSCWCATLNGKTKCHGDILAKKIIEIASEIQNNENDIKIEISR
jgi:hypothetical protein